METPRVNTGVHHHASGLVTLAFAESTGAELVNVHQTMQDLRVHSAPFYWADLLLCATIFWTLVLLGCQSLRWFPVALIVGSLALYRMALFTHEICHFKSGVLPGFEATWNVVCGVPILLPSYMLNSHVDHHATRSYGTPADPEYLPFASFPQLRRSFLLGSALVPVAMVVRSLILVPAAWVLPGLHVYLRERLTFMTMNSAYRPGPTLRLTRSDHVAEITTSLWTWGLIVASATGAVPWPFAVLLLACMTLANLLNGWRTLQAHLYTSQGQTMDAKAQVRDSTTFTTCWLRGELLCPVGQRFHAAHHLLPYLPYHALPEAHRRLISTEWAGRSDYLATFTNPLRSNSSA